LVSEAGLGELEDFIDLVFGDDKFAGTKIQKAQFAKELLKDELSKPSWRLIRDKFRYQANLTDKRHTEEYAFDLVMGWIQEEVVIRALLKHGNGEIDCERVGVDATREFTKGAPTADADFIVQIGERKFPIDLFCDSNGHWKKTGIMDLKIGKVNHLLAKSLYAVLGLDVKARTYHWIDESMVIGLTTTLNRSMGNNEVVKVQCPNPLSLSEVVHKLHLPAT
jgi:hypothetical protein